jgi:tRNA dimethylallyltransferase
LRAELEHVLLPDLLQELRSRDPATFATIDRSNRRRVTRAVEVIRLTGKPFSEQRADWREPATTPAMVAHQEGMALPFFCLQRPRDELLRRIDQRVEAMFAQGLVVETEALLQLRLPRQQPAMQALGYRQVIDYLQGVRPLEPTVALVKQKTRQYAKRQMTWFRHQASAEWFEIREGDTTASVAEALEARYLQEVKRE